MDCPFIVGQRVQCVIPSECGPWNILRAFPNTIVPHHNGIYTIRSIDVYPQFMGTIFLRFMEFFNPIMPNSIPKGVEASFDHRFFRPLNERKTDISVFEKLTRPNTIKKELKIPEKHLEPQ